MTEISKAAQQALDALIYHVEQTRPIERTTQAITALRAALQDKAGEVTVAIDNLYNERRDGMTNAIFPPVQIGTRLFAAQPAPVVPDDHPLVVFAKECSLGAYTEREVIQEAGKALAASQQKGGQHG